MYQRDGLTYYSASDLTQFLGCAHATYLDIREPLDGLIRAANDGHPKLLQEKGLAHEKQYLEKLRGLGLTIKEIDFTKEDWAGRFEATKKAIKEGYDIIYQGALLDTPWQGYADFLRKVTEPTAPLGYYYEVIDTKLARDASPKHVLQLCIYGDLLAKEQGFEPPYMHLVLGDGREINFRFADFAYYYRNIKNRFSSFVQQPSQESYPEPCAQCDLCHWRDHCSDTWVQDDHLTLVANIQSGQIAKLQKNKIQTLTQLAQLPETTRIPKMQQETTKRLRQQAQLQLKKRETNQSSYELLQTPQDRGFYRLPAADGGDIYFDMEGDPLYPDGLEYLFGLCLPDKKFQYFLALDHEQEKIAFEGFMDFVTRHLQAHPNAHIYHYNHYEVTALKRLASRYSTREEEMDDLLRGQKFIDLYKVVREGIRISEDSYSLKKLEVFYMPKRDGDVTTAGDSIVFFEKFLETGERKLIDDIISYNEIDCLSTLGLRQWLDKIKSPDIPYRIGLKVTPSPERLQKQQESIAIQEKLLRSGSAAERELRQTVSTLVDFHRREQKPQWWAYFEQLEMEPEELIENAECLGGLVREYGVPMRTIARSKGITFRFPKQDSKIKAGSKVRIKQNPQLTSPEVTALDYENSLIELKTTKPQEIPDQIDLLGNVPLNIDVLRKAMHRFANAIVDQPEHYKPAIDLLQRHYPRIKGRAEKQPIILDRNDFTNSVSRVIGNLDHSYLFIQGPPGTGKTYTTSHVIIDLMRQGKKIAISSNSHKAIHNLLEQIEDIARKTGFSFRGQKKSSGDDSDYNSNYVSSVRSNDDISLSSNLVAGTVYLFADEKFDQHFDYLFVDEAGQVSIANIIVMGMAAKNIVLIGDQMQLSQPIQGVHPGESGLSALDYLLQGKSTIDVERGILLDVTRRMHPSVCQFISDSVYDGRLLAADLTGNRNLLLDNAHSNLRPHGIRFLPIEHEGCTQKSEEEAEIIKKLYNNLLTQKFVDRSNSGVERIVRLGVEDILVVTPYNMQVNLLKDTLQNEARVGTVDKFQGQEAPVVLISLVVSNAADIPRNMEFLYSKNRLNVAISRAQCLAVIVANPNLLKIACKTVDQMRLVNTLCWLADYAKQEPPDKGRIAA